MHSMKIKITKKVLLICGALFYYLEEFSSVELRKTTWFKSVFVKEL
jgi:hypothetical protein